MNGPAKFDARLPSLTPAAQCAPESAASAFPRSFAFGPFVLIPERQLLLRGETPVRIGGRALDILTALIECPGEVVGKRQLMARVWPDVVVEEGNLKVHIAGLRQALGGTPGADRYIATVIGRGYRFVAPVRAGGKPPHLWPASAEGGRHHNLPTGTTRIFGREQVIDGIRRDLEESRLVSIVGPGGIGKTTVALAVGEQAVGSFKDGVWLVDLALLKDPAFAPNAVATAVGLAAHSASMLAPLCEYLQGREMLLVIDNCEHIIESAAACAGRVLADAPGVKILVTSREPLLVKGERVRRLAGLGTPPHAPALRADEALGFPAIQLFVDRATDRFESFVLSDADAPKVAEICRKLDGLALAIEFAATRVEAFGVGGLLDQLAHRFHHFLGRRAGPERQRTLAATLDWSYSLLSAREAALLSAVAVFAGVFDAAGASAVADLPPAETSEILALLAEKSLLATDIDGVGVGVGYRLLETTRTYCLERLQADGEDPVIRHRHAEHVCRVLERAAAEWPQRTPAEWGAAYGRNLDDLRGALAWAGQDARHRSLRIRLAVAGILLWNHFSLTEECRVQASQAVEELNAAGLAGTAAEMQLQVWLGGVSMFTHGPLPPAQAAMRRALEIAVRIGDKETQLRCLRLIGVHETFSGEFDAAIGTLQTYVSVAAAQFPSAALDAEVALGKAELFAGQLRSVRQRFEQRHELDLKDAAEAAGQRHHVRYLSDRIVDVDNLLSIAQWLTGSPATAVRTARASIAHARGIDHHLSLCNALSWSAPIFYWTGLYEDGERCITMLEDQARRHGFAVRRPVVMFYRAALASAQGGVTADLVDDMERAIAAYHATGHLARLPFHLGVAAESLLALGRSGDAAIKIQAALDRAGAKNERWCAPELLRIRASILRAQGRAQEAEPVLAQALALAEETGALAWKLRAAIELARLWHAQSRTRDAREMLLPIYGQFTEGRETRDLAIAAALLASLKRSRKG